MSLRAVVAAALLPYGFLALWRLPNGAASAAAAAFSAVAVAAACAAHPTLITPDAGGAGLLLALALPAAWALGRTLPPTTLRCALLAAVCLQTLLAVVQSTGPLAPLVPAPHRGGVHGTLGNPVHLAALLTAAVCLLPTVRGRLCTSAACIPLALAAAFGATLALTGARVAVALALVAVVARPAPRLWLTVALVAGFVAATLAAPAVAPAVTTGAERLHAAHAAYLSHRPATWAAAVHQLGRRPVLGYGPGRFAALHAGSGERFTDAHNLPVEYAATTGLVGFAALAAFVALAVRSARGPLRAFALVLLVAGLYEPQHFATTVVAFVALGAAWEMRRGAETASGLSPLPSCSGPPGPPLASSAAPAACPAPALASPTGARGACGPTAGAFAPAPPAVACHRSTACGRSATNTPPPALGKPAFMSVVKAGPPPTPKDFFLPVASLRAAPENNPPQGGPPLRGGPTARPGQRTHSLPAGTPDCKSSAPRGSPTSSRPLPPRTGASQAQRRGWPCLREEIIMSEFATFVIQTVLDGKAQAACHFCRKLISGSSTLVLDSDAPQFICHACEAEVWPEDDEYESAHNSPAFPTGDDTATCRDIVETTISRLLGLSAGDQMLVHAQLTLAMEAAL